MFWNRAVSASILENAPPQGFAADVDKDAHHDGHRRATMKFTFPPESKPLAGYTIRRGIHRGGFGEVYYAVSDAGKEVALKLLQNNTDIELRGVSQCLNLKHPNLVTIFDVRTDADGDHWVIMEYISGSSLEDVLDAFPRGMSLGEVQAWLSGIVAGVGFLHDRGLVHRDLKPANIYRENGVVKVGDVGLSKLISHSRRDGQTQSIGTVYYMAPEVAHGRYGREVDVYSIGVILYEMLAGRVPFDGETAGEILMKHLSEKPDLTPIPPALRPVLARALEKDPQQRTPTVAELERDFARAIAGRPVTESRPPELPPERFTSGPQNNGARPNGYRPVDWGTHVTQPWRAASAQAGAAATARRRRADFSLLLKIAAAVIVFLALVAPGAIPWLICGIFYAAIYALMGYALYRVARFCLSIAGFDSTPATAPHHVPVRPHRGFVPVPPAAPVQPVVARRPEPPRPAKKLTPETVRLIPLRRRVAELSASMTFAVLCTAVITAGLGLVCSAFPDCALALFGDELEPGRIGLFAITTLLAAWAVLIPSKFSEGTEIDPGMRRFTLLLAGAAVGASAYWLDRVLMVGLPMDAFLADALFERVGSHSLVMQVSAFDGPGRLAAHQPSWLGYVVFFAGLLGLRRWWRHADEFRTRRFRISSLLLTVGVAFLVSLIWEFPQVWAMVWAAAISGVVQISAAWVPPAERPALVENRAAG